MIHQIKDKIIHDTESDKHVVYFELVLNFK